MRRTTPRRACLASALAGLFLLLALPAPLRGEQSADPLSGLVRSLLAEPAPPTNWEEHLGMVLRASPEDEAAGRVPVPPDDAPVDFLVAFWSDRYWRKDKAEPSARVRQRLLDACRENPRYLMFLWPLLPETPEACEFVKKVHDVAAAEGAGIDRHLRWWLVRHSRYFLPELAEEARKARYEDGEFRGREELETLARLDWESARAILEGFSASRDSRAKAYALATLYTHAVATGAPESAALRDKLKSLACDRAAHGFERHQALCALLSTEWPGFDEWYLSLFEDGSLLHLPFGDPLRTKPLAIPAARDPDRWVPIIAGKVGNPNRDVHDAAVSCLLYFTLERARPDALRPLLPWLDDPRWSSVPGRVEFIQSLTRVDLPESVPLLIRALDRGLIYYEQDAAIAVLTAHGDPASIPTLRRFLSREVLQCGRGAIYLALAAGGGLSVEEMVGGLEAMAALTLSQEGRKRIDEDRRLPQDVGLGVFVSRLKTPSGQLAEAAVARIVALRETAPERSDAMLDIVSAWPSRAVARHLLQRLEEGTIPFRCALALLGAADRIRRKAPAELGRLAAKGGVAGALAAVLSGDAQAISAVIEAGNEDAHLALLAGARLARLELPADRVGAWMRSDRETRARAAEEYLLDRGGLGAFEQIWKAHPGERRILGRRMRFDPGHHAFEDFDRLEGRLRAEFEGPNPPEEVFALLSAGYWGDEGQKRIVVRKGEARITVEYGGGRTASRTLSPPEMKGFRDFLDARSVDGLPPLDPTIHDGIQNEYVRLTPSGGLRVFMNNPDAPGNLGTVYDRLVEMFDRLAASGRLDVRHKVCDEVAGSAIVFAHDKVHATSAWKSGDDLRVLLRRADGGSSWRRMAEGTPGEETLPPGDLPAVVAEEKWPEGMVVYDHLNRPPWLSQTPLGRIFVSHDALWRFPDGREPERLAVGCFADPVMTADARWVVLAKADRGWAHPNHVVRFNLETRDEFRVDVPAADNFDPVAFVPARGKVLLFRSKDEEDWPDKESAGPDAPEFRLLDPASGETEIVRGEFRPWFHQTWRPLQESRTADVVWAAIPGEDATAVGKYDTRRFVFEALAVFPSVRFGSLSTWVDEDEKAVYAAVMGDLLRLPLGK